MPAVLSLGIAHGASPVSRCTCPPGIHRNLPPLFILSQCLQGFFTRTLQLCGQHRIEAQQSNFLQNKFSFLQNSVNLQGQLLAKQAKSAVSTFPESFVPIQEFFGQNLQIPGTCCCVFLVWNMHYFYCKSTKSTLHSLLYKLQEA